MKIYLRMRTKVLVLIAACVTLAACGTVPVWAYRLLDSAEQWITSSGTISITPGPLLDDFNTASERNKWNDLTDVFSSAGFPMPGDALCAAYYIDDPAVVFLNYGYSLKLNYNVTLTNGYVGYFSKLGNANLAACNNVSFWVRGGAGGEYFKIQLTDDLGNRSSVYVTDYLDGGVTTTWKKVTIPFDAFANLARRTALTELAIVFENAQCDWNSSPKIGTVYIDNISFGWQFLGFVRLNNFSKKGPDAYNTASMNNATGGNSGAISWDGTTHNYTASAVSTQYVSAPNSLRFNFTGMSGGSNRWDAYYMIIGGGANGSTEVPRNFSNYSQLTYYIKGNAGNEYGIRVELKCSERATYNFQKNIISTAWTKRTIALSDFKDADINGAPSGNSVNPATIRKCAFVYTYWLWYWNPNRIAAGTIFIDDVQFEATGYTKDTTVPAAPSVPVVSGFGTVTLTSTASSRFTDSTMEQVRFQYSNDQATWKTFGFDYDTTDGTYSARLDMTNFFPTTYYFRAVSADTAGNATVSGTTTYTKI